MTDIHHIIKVESIEELKELFPEGQADQRNWCFFGTCGIAGNLNKINQLFKEEFKDDEILDNIYVVAFQPRRLIIHYGIIKVSLKDIPYLKQLARSTLTAIAKSQANNY